MADWQNDIERYRNGELTPAEMHALEKRALSDPFLADALEGSTELTPEDFSADVAALREALTDKTRKVVPLWKLMMRIAAGLVILVISGWILITYYGPPSQKLAVIESPKAPAPVMPNRDSVRQAEKDRIISKETAETPLLSKAEVPAKASKPSPVEGSAKEKIMEQKDDLLAIQESVAEAESTNVPVPASVPSVLDGRTSGVAIQRRARAMSNTTESKKRTIAGTVKDSEDGYVMPGVNVTVKGTSVGTITDGDGRFNLSLDSIPESLQFSFIGFESTEVVPGSQQTLNIVMDPSISELSEVVVVGYASSYDKADQETQMEWAQPDGGKRAYREYLQNNLRYPDIALNNKVEGRVTVQFTVETNGSISNIKVLRGIGFGCEEEVIRLIKSGPKWNPTKKNTVAMPDKVRVRMRFSLPGKK